MTTPDEMPPFITQHRGRAEPLIVIFDEENGEPVERYVVGWEAAAAFSTEETRRKAMEAIGAWEDLDWEELSAELDRIRHANPPTPPIELDDD